MKHNQRHQPDDDAKKASGISAHADATNKAEVSEQGARGEQREEGEVDGAAIAGVSIVRSNTPRPFSFETLKAVSGHFKHFPLDASSLVPPVFPTQAPSAPPLPEELGGPEAINAAMTDRAGVPATTTGEVGEPEDSDSGDALDALTTSPGTGLSTALSLTESQRPDDRIQELLTDPKEGSSRLEERKDREDREDLVMQEERDKHANMFEERGERLSVRELSRELPEFLWLFEYGLEMDPSILNSPERLARLALPYGPAVLKGYTLVLGAQSIHGSSGSTIVAIVPDSDPDAEVWGMLYRIPRRVTEANGDEPSLLDTIHAAITPQKFFKGVEVVVRETYRERDVTSIAYVATDVAAQQLHLVTTKEWDKDPAFIQRLATIAQKQKLPASYIEQFVRNQLRREHVPAVGTLPLTPKSGMSAAHMASTPDAAGAEDAADTVHSTKNSHHVPVSERPLSLPEGLHLHTAHFAAHATIPLSALGEGEAPAGTPLPGSENSVDAYPSTGQISRSMAGAKTRQTDPWLLSFALYLALLLLLALTFAVLQGLGLMNALFNSNFTPLGVPWLVMMYGLLGGCISSIVTLSRFRSDCPPAFIIVTWFTRPFIGSILAALSHVLLASGIFDSTSAM